MSERVEVVLVFEDDHNKRIRTPIEQRLRGLLRIALRGFHVRCVSFKQLNPKTPGPFTTSAVEGVGPVPAPTETKRG